MCDFCDAYWLGIGHEELYDLRNPVIGKYRRLFPGCAGWQYAAAAKRELGTGIEADSKQSVCAASIYPVKGNPRVLPSTLEAYEQALARFKELLAEATDEPIYEVPHHCSPITLPRPKFIEREIELLQRDFSKLVERNAQIVQPQLDDLKTEMKELKRLQKLSKKD
jgi:hypothetical protein